MNVTTSTLYPWQHQAWQQLQVLNGRWPHAILLHGPEGIGKKILAEWMAQSLLCESQETDGQACGRCASCGWFSEYNHPDYRRVCPEILEPAAPDNDEVTAKSAAKTATKAATTAAKTPSKEIVINQIRNLSDFMTVSTHRQGKRVIVIYPAESLNIAASNALLKSLEEPAPNTVFILVTCSTDSLLPTLVSRCHQFALTLPSREQALRWLADQGLKEPEPFLDEQGGSPLAALAASQSETQEQQREFLTYLQHPNIGGALVLADKLQKLPVSLLITWLQRWLYDVFSSKLSGKIRYYPTYQKEIKSVGALISVPALLMLLDENAQRRAVAEHPLSAKLLIEEMLLDYVGSCKS